MDVSAGVTQEEDHTGFLFHLSSAVLALIFLARRFQPFLSLVDRQVEFLRTNDIALMIVLHLLYGILFFWRGRKNPSSCDCTGIRTHVPTSEGFEVTKCSTGTTGTSLRVCISHYAFKIIVS